MSKKLCVAIFIAILGTFIFFMKIYNSETPQVHQPVISRTTIIDDTYNIKAYSNNSYEFTVAATSTKTNIKVEVLHGNKLNFFIIDDESEFRHYRKDEPFECVSGSASKGMFEYFFERHLEPGKYYLCIQDNSLGILSNQTSNIKVTVIDEIER